MKTPSRLEKLLEAGHFVVTGELGPPKGNNVAAVKKKAALLRGYVDAVNITDNQTAVVRMSSIATAVVAQQQGLEPVMQMVCRDRNRIAMQSDIIGAAALGIPNVLCLSGDHQQFGNQAHSKNVFDIDSIQLVGAMRRLRDENKLLDSDEKLDGPVKMFIGAAANPFAEPFEFRPYRLKKKVEAGADFIQTQCVFDLEIFEQWLSKARDLGLTERCHILAGVIPLKSGRMAKYMAEHVPGVIMPEAIVKRMVDAPKGKGGIEGVKICCELIDALKEMKGLSGVHIMAIEWEKKVPKIVEKANLFPRPAID